MKVAITGALGQLGSELCRQIGPQAIPLDIDTLDLTNKNAVLKTLVGLKPATIINCAAYTQVNKAESEPDLAHAVNATAVEHLVRVCRELGCPLLQISTDYVFGGHKAEGGNNCPFREDDAPAPQSVYAKTKLAGEQAAAQYEKHLIVRTCGLYARPSDVRANNFIRTMLRLGAHTGKSAWLPISIVRPAMFRTWPGRSCF